MTPDKTPGPAQEVGQRGRTPAAPRSALRSRRAFGLVDGLLALSIFAAFIVGASRWINNGLNEQSARGEATRWVQMTKAADSYLKSQDGILKSIFQADGTKTVVVPITSGKAGAVAFNAGGTGLAPSFKDAHVLGANFLDNQTESRSAALVVYQPTGALDYEAVLVGYPTGGKGGLTDEVLTRAEGMSESRIGGLMSSDPAGGGMIRGPKGGWAIPVGALSGSNVPIVKGNLFSYVTLEKRGGNDDSRYLVRTPDSNPDNNTMQTDIRMDGYGLTNVDHLCGAATAAPAANINDTSCDGSRRIDIGGDMVSNGGLYAAHDVRTDTGVVAPIFYSGNTSGYDQNYYLQPDGKSKLQSVQSDWLDLDTKVFSSGSTRPDMPTAAAPLGSAKTDQSGKLTLKLADLIPNEVVKASYVVHDLSVVPKPDCGDGGPGVGNRARIAASLTSLYNAADPTVTPSGSIQYTQIPVLSGYSVYSCGDNCVGGYGTYATVNSVNGGTTAVNVQPSTFYNQVTAADQGASWQMHLPSVLVRSDGTQSTVDEGSNPPNTAFVQTSCYYAHS